MCLLLLWFKKKLEIGASDDKYEAEAERMADQVLQMKPIDVDKPRPPTSSIIQRKCANCEEEERIQKKSLSEQITPLIQRKASNTGGDSIASDAVSTKINQSKGGGRPLAKNTRGFMESGFGSDFSNIRVHTDSNAVNLNRELNAQAFTVGNDIYFNEGKYQPNSHSGKHLLAHELTHTIQQRDMKSAIQREAIPLQSAHPTCDSSNPIRINRERHFELGTVAPPASNCTFTPNFHIEGSSVHITASAVNPPQGDWRITVFSCLQRFAARADCDRVYGESNSASGSISNSLLFHYDPTLWANRKIYIRIRNGSQHSIPNVSLSLRPVQSDTISTILHSALDALGLIPVLGIVPDTVNAGYYLIEGDFLGAGISAAAMVPIFGIGAGVTRLGVRVTAESVERLGRDGVERAVREGIASAGTRVLRRAPSGRLVRALRSFSGRNFRVGSETFLLDSRGMRHILERHHPNYWDGTVRATQSFFDDSLNIDGVTRIIQEVVSQNRETLIRRGTRGMYQVTGTWGGRRYQLGLNNGRIGQFFPL